MFKRPMISWREDGQRRQRRLFNLVRSNDLVDRILAARLGPDANSTPPANPPHAYSGATTPSQDEQPVEAENPSAEQEFAMANGNGAVESHAVNEPEAITSPAPDNPPDSEDYDEPQPRSTRRRRPFTSRLLGR